MNATPVSYTHLYDKFWDPLNPAFSSRYLCCGHAFVMVGKASERFFTDPDAGVLGQFRHQYFLVNLIAHFHKAALMLFSEWLAAAISQLDIRDLDSVSYTHLDVYKRQPFYNVMLAIAMWFGRFAVIVPVLAMAGSLAAKKRIAATAGTLPTHGPLFVTLLIGAVLLVGLLNYILALALGPVVEHFMLWAGH